MGHFVDEAHTSSMRQQKSLSSSYKRTSGPHMVSTDSYEQMPSNLGGSGTATRTVSYKKTTSFKKTVEVPESTETVTLTHTTAPIETEDDKANLLMDDQMITFNFDEDD